MITSKKIRGGESYLSDHLTYNDYYTEYERVSGEWLGKGAQRLGIERQSVDAGDKCFDTFRRNRLPGGGKLTPRDRDDRITFIDFQCACPKSVSIMASTMGDYRIVEAHRASVEVAFREMEAFAAAQANTLTERINRFTGNLIAARFTHTSSRALDPQVHDHLVTVAATYDEAAGGWRALTEYEIYKRVAYLSRVYQNELAIRCRELGYELRPSYDERNRVIGFELKGVSDELNERFSKRREQIERAIGYFEDKHGRAPTKAEIDIMVRQTRDRKLTESTTPQVIANQRAQLSPEERDALDELKRTAMARAGEGVELGIEPWAAKEGLHKAISRVYERDCAAPGHAILAEALKENAGGLRLDELKRAMSGPELVPVGHGDGDVRNEIFITPAELRREGWLLSVAGDERGALRPLAEEVSVAERLSEEQSRAVKELLSCKDRLACLRGAAGVGKSTVITEIDRNLKDAGRKVIHCAPTASAADTLRKEGLSGAVTLASFLAEADKTEMPAGSVLVVDEAGLASHRDGQAVLRLAIKRDLRVVFVGDTKQHSAVEAGDFLRLMESKGGIYRVELTEIRRQTDKDYRNAVRLMSQGEAQRGLLQLAGMGCLNEGGSEYLQNAAKDYLDAIAADPGKSVLCVTPTWVENHTLTEAIRDGLKRSGTLGEGAIFRVDEPLSWTAQEKGDPTRYRQGLTVVFDRRTGSFDKGESAAVVLAENDQVHVLRRDGGVQRLSLAHGGFDVCVKREIEVSPGDTLLLRANDKTAGLVNGMTLRVESVTDGVIRTEEGLSINPDEYARFSHGYVLTSYKSQGKTCDKVVVAATKLDAKTAYVACSRGRASCSIHTPDKAILLKAIPPGDRPLAAEQPGFFEHARMRSEPGVEIARLGWFTGPWSRLTEMAKTLLPQGGLVDAKDRVEKHHEKLHSPL